LSASRPPEAASTSSAAHRRRARRATAPAERGDKEAARAITDYRTLDHAGQKLAWLELSPLTGRTHQLRVHCVAIGAPILGDVK
jgi:23S rRNA pseudouridine955/2504/2580 synthase